MSDPLPPTAPVASSAAPVRKIFNCFSGALVAGGLAVLLYRLMLAIATTFAQKPLLSDNVTVINIASAVRTLVVGSVALGAGVFGLAGLGLFLLGLQLTGQRLFGGNRSAADL